MKCRDSLLSLTYPKKNGCPPIWVRVFQVMFCRPTGHCVRSYGYTTFALTQVHCHALEHFITWGRLDLSGTLITGLTLVPPEESQNCSTIDWIFRQVHSRYVYKLGDGKLHFIANLLVILLTAVQI